MFLQQLYALLAQLISPGPDCHNTPDGTDLVVDDGTTQVRVHGNDASISAIETYFERHHSTAATAVIVLAQRSLHSLDQVRTSLHFDLSGLGRRRELFSVRTPLPRGRELSIYAKNPQRLRFELRRLTTGRYGAQTNFAPTDQLLNRINFERSFALQACDWPEVGRLFTETPEPTIGDLGNLVVEVAAACQRHGQEPNDIFPALLLNNALVVRPNDEAAYRALIKDLVGRNILHRVTLRRRDSRGTARVFGLTEDQAAVLQTVQSAFSRASD